MEIGFDNELYMHKQAEEILKRIEECSGKLYLEFGGKLFDDFHASRVLPGFDVNGKVKLLRKLRDQAEIILCINAADIEHNKVRADIGITYDQDSFRLIDSLRSMDLTINSVVITQYDSQPAADTFRKRLEQRGERVFVHTLTKGYPTDVATIVSDEGYGKNPYVDTSKPLVVVTAPGPSSGKLATCLSQLYHEHKRGIMSGYAKFETFPVWNIPLKHPVNLAYEAATADLNDVNMIDPYHLDAYGKQAVNYNRDVEVFPVIRTILSKTTGVESLYRSPTDMGVNMAGYCITDDDAVRAAAKQEIIRRYYRALRDVRMGRLDSQAVKRIELIMNELEINIEDRVVVTHALEKERKRNAPAAAIMLADGTVVTGRATKLLNAPASMLINALKKLGGISDRLHLIAPLVLEPIFKLKKNELGSRNPSLNLDETLICLSICAATNPMAEHAMSMLPGIRSCEAHATYIISDSDERIIRKLGINLTCEPSFPSKDLYYE